MKMKVLHVVRIPATVHAFLEPVIAAQKERGHDVELAFGTECSQQMDLGVPVHLYPIRRSICPHLLVPAITGLKKIMREGNYDLIVAHMALVGIIARIAFGLAGKPGRLLYVSHGLPCYPTCPQPQRTLALLAERLLARWTNSMVVLNRHDYRMAEKYKLAGPEGRVHFLRSVGIDCQAVAQRVHEIDIDSFRKKLGVDTDLPLVCYAGRFIRAKGVQLFVEIARKYVDSGGRAIFLIAGSGPLDGYVRNFISQHKLHNSIKMLGWYDDMIGLLAVSDVLCFPTLYEGSPIIVQESMASGTAVLTSRVPGPDHLIDNGVDGILVKPGDIDGFVRSLEMLLENTQFRSQIVMNAKSTAQQFDISNCVKPWVDVIESMGQTESQRIHNMWF